MIHVSNSMSSPADYQDTEFEDDFDDDDDDPSSDFE